MRVPSFEVAPFGGAPRAADMRALLENEFFAGVAADVVLHFGAEFKVTSLPAGALLYEPWERSTHVILVLAGCIGLGREDLWSSNTDLGSVDGGSFCGEEAFFPSALGMHRLAAVCREPSTISFALARDLEPLLEAAPRVAFNVAGSLHRRLATLFDDIAGSLPPQR